MRIRRARDRRSGAISRQEQDRSGETHLQKREPQWRKGRNFSQSSHRPPHSPLRPAIISETELRAAAVSSQAALNKRRRPKKSATRSYTRTRRWITWIAGAAAAASGFIAVLWLTGPVTAPDTPAIRSLAHATVSNAASLMAAVQTAGLHGTSDVKGAIEEIKRLDSERVTIKGWVADTTASGSSLTVVAFAGGNHALTTVTKGARRDIAKTLGLADASAANMSFADAFACRPGEKLVVIAVTSGNAYSQFRSLACP